MKQILIGCICSLIAVGIASAQEEWMPDSNLRQAVRDELGLPNEIPLQPAEMLRLTELEASSRQITDLTGLEHAIHLTYLGIARNAIQALTPLSGLIRLESIVGFDNEISDLTPLSNLTNLKWLDLGGCQISDHPNSRLNTIRRPSRSLEFDRRCNTLSTSDTTGRFVVG